MDLTTFIVLHGNRFDPCVIGCLDTQSNKPFFDTEEKMTH